jgi:hypothetical protein
MVVPVPPGLHERVPEPDPRPDLGQSKQADAGSRLGVADLTFPRHPWLPPEWPERLPKDPETSRPELEPDIETEFGCHTTLDQAAVNDNRGKCLKLDKVLAEGEHAQYSVPERDSGSLDDHIGAGLITDGRCDHACLRKPHDGLEVSGFHGEHQVIAHSRTQESAEPGERQGGG